ncbi:MAG: apolipoprotein N-acyltransferase [Candidatus Coatesbacteria bacterium]|nr:apolipoprotein N-acyltransferase [Candidatus Coatesbacteria bacterium]
MRIDYWRKAAIAAGSGLLLALAFPRFELFYLVFVALVPLFIALRGEKGLRAFGLGFTTGFVFHLISLFWITEAMSNYSALGLWPSVLILLLLVAYLAALVGVFANVVSLCGLEGLGTILIPMFWVALEFTKSKLFSGFPWNDLSWALYRQTRLIQIADVLGSYGVSFGIVLVNWLVFLILTRLLKLRVEPGWSRPLAALAAVFVFAWGYGSVRLLSFSPSPISPPPTKVGIIQPNIPQAMKLSGRFEAETLRTYEQQAAELRAKGVDIMVLPEAAINDPYNVRPDLQGWVKKTFSDPGSLGPAGCTVLFGALAMENGQYMNSAFVVDPAGRTHRYDKVHLVPFGEYVPFSWLLSFVEAIAGYQGSLTEGPGHSVLPLGDLTIGVPICYEIVFPEISREFVNKGADLICTLSNDAWFGETSGPYQHFSATVLRAIENRVPVLRCANSGVSGLVDATGRIRLETPIYTRRTDVVEVQIAKQTSVFRKVGELFAYLCSVGSILAGIKGARRTGTNPRQPLGRRVF